MLSRAGGLKEDEHAIVDKCPQEERDDTDLGKRRPAGTPLFSSPASALFLHQLELLTSRPSPQHTAIAPMWARRLCGRWLLMQRLRRGITAEVIADQARVDADTLHLLELGLVYDVGADDERLERLACLLATRQSDADLIGAVLRVAIGAATITPALLERVSGEVRPPEPVDDGQ